MSKNVILLGNMECFGSIGVITGAACYLLRFYSEGGYILWKVDVFSMGQNKWAERVLLFFIQHGLVNWLVMAL